MSTPPAAVLGARPIPRRRRKMRRELRPGLVLSPSGSHPPFPSSLRICTPLSFDRLIRQGCHANGRVNYCITSVTFPARGLALRTNGFTWATAGATNSLRPALSLGDSPSHEQTMDQGANAKVWFFGGKPSGRHTRTWLWIHPRSVLGAT